ncbi:MAG: cation-translocating P-type ATPase [Planctomycetota bacterium]
MSQAPVIAPIDPASAAAPDFGEVPPELSAGEDRRKSELKILATFVGGTMLLCAALAHWLFAHPGHAQIIAGVAAVLMGLPIVYEAVRSLVSPAKGGGSRATWQLVAVAIVAALATDRYFSSAAVAFFMLIASFIEERTAVGARQMIESLVRITPTKARRLAEDGSETEIDAAELRPDDRVVIRPGDNIPGDGIIESGQSTVNQANITGESLPVDKNEGDEVFSGTINETGVLRVRITRAGSDSTLSRVKELIFQAADSRPPVVRMLDRYAGFYTPTVLMIAAILVFLTQDVELAITFILIVCPVEILMAGPTAMVASLSSAARLRVLVKSVGDLETAQRVTAIVFDKTGTITTGKLNVSRLQPAEGVEAASLLQVCASLEKDSNHPVARAVMAISEKAKVTPVEVAQFEEVPGRGVRGTIDGVSVLAGRKAWIEEQGVDCSGLDLSDAEGMSLLFVARSGVALGWIGLEDKARPQAPAVMKQLNEEGVKTRVMITGDAWGAARRVAQEVSVTDVQAEALPGDKLDLVKALRAKGHTVAVVGDGVNDGPALAAGDISIAMGAAGSDVAVQSASIALMSNNLNRVPFLFHLSRRTIRIIRQNLIGLLIYILIMLALLAAGFVTPWIAAIGHGVSGIAVVFNSARLFREGENLADEEPPLLPQGGEKGRSAPRIEHVATA